MLHWYIIYLLGLNRIFQMLAVWLISYHISLSINQRNVIVGLSHVDLFSFKISINYYTWMVNPPGKFINHAKYRWKTTNLSGSSTQSSGKLTPGWGQAGQNKARSPFPGMLSLMWPYPNLFFNSKTRHCLKALKSSRYLFCSIWYIVINDWFG